MIEWKQDGKRYSAIFTGRLLGSNFFGDFKLEMLPTKGAGTGYGGWHGYIDGKHSGDAADNIDDLESMLLDKFERPSQSDAGASGDCDAKP